jgi:glutamate dehydrogenase/leucine dehydrogenase
MLSGAAGRAGEAMEKDAVLGHPCDVLIPAAIGGVIDEHTAQAVQARR